MHVPLVIIGSGPAGHTAAIYTARAGLAPIMFEGFMAGGVPAGGQLVQTHLVENFPGFPQGILGSDLMDNMREQSINSGAIIKTETIEKVDLSQKPYALYTESGEEIKADSIIIATGATARLMDIPGNNEYWQRGISACAICDGALPVFANSPLAVVGGGDSACEEALYLTRYAKKVHMFLRSGVFRASKIMEKRVRENPKIEVHLFTTPIEALGDGKFLTGLRLKNTQSGDISVIDIKGLFYAIGHVPNTGFLGNQLELDSVGYLIVQDDIKTNKEGIYAAGDVADPHYRQAVVAAGSGCKAALESIRYLQNLEN